MKEQIRKLYKWVKFKLCKHEFEYKTRTHLTKHYGISEGYNLCKKCGAEKSISRALFN